MENPAFKTALGLMIKLMTQGDATKQHANHQVILPIGPTPPVLLDLGMPNLELVILGKVVDKVIFEHGIPKGTLERIHTLLKSPKAIYKGHQDNPGSAVVTFEIKNMAPIIIAVHPNKQIGRYMYNNVASMYAKSTRAGESIEDRWTKEGLLLWKAKPVPLVVPVALKIAGQK